MKSQIFTYDHAHGSPVNARFWVWENGGNVRLSLRDGQELRFSTYTETDEGYHLASIRWYREGDVIYREWLDTGKDCDGTHADGGHQECPISIHMTGEVHAHTDGTTTHYPRWDELDTWTYDQFAEMANY